MSGGRLAPLDDLRRKLAQFVEQTDRGALILTCFDQEIPVIAKVLDALDGELTSDVVLFHTEPVLDVASYVRGLIVAIDGRLKEANDERVEAGAPLLSPLPALCLDPQRDALTRARALIAHLETWLPDGDGHRMLIALLPECIVDRAAHAQVLGAIAPFQGHVGWPPRLRLVVREDQGAPFVIDALRRNRATAPYVLTSGTTVNDFADAVAAEVADTSVPPGRRMNALLQCAYFDVGAGRFEAALEKFGVLHNYYAKHNVRELEAMVLYGVGDVLQRIERWEGAEEWYARSLDLASDLRSLPLIMQASAALAELAMLRRAWHKADIGFGLASDAAGKLGNAFLRADHLEKCGDARMALGNPNGAVMAWRAVVDETRSTGYDQRLATSLSRLEDSARRAGFGPEADAFRRQLVEVQARLRLQGAA